MATSPGGELELGIDDAGAKAANVVIEPEAIVGQMLACDGGDVDQATHEAAGCAATTIADPHALVLGTAGAALQIA